MSRRVILVLLAVLSLAPVSAAALDITFIKASTTALEEPHGLKLSPGGKSLVVADVGNNCIVALDPHTRGLIAGFGSDHQCGIPDMDFDVAEKAEPPRIESSRAATGVAQFIALCSSLKHLIHGWKHFCRAVEKYVHDIEVYSLILSVQVI